MSSFELESKKRPPATSGAFSLMAVLWRGGFGFVVVMVLLGVLGVSGVRASSVSVGVVSVDCGVAEGVVSATVTGEVGDSVSFVNSSASGSCTVSHFSGVVTFTGLVSGSLPAQSTAVATLVSAGTFTITPQAGSGTPGIVTTVIGAPVLVPEYEVTFDANGGSCSSNPLTITVGGGQWYALPTEGTGAFQCHRQGYELVGWIRRDTLLYGGSGVQAPDVPVGTQAQVADHVMLHAIWRPLGVEIVYDANVAAQHACFNDAGDDLDLQDRTSTVMVNESEVQGYRLSRKAPCVPAGHNLAGWTLTAQAPEDSATYSMPEKALKERRITLYASWVTSDRCDLSFLTSPTPQQIRSGVVDYSGCDFSGQDFTKINWGAVSVRPDFSYADLQNTNFKDVPFTARDLSHANLSGADISISLPADGPDGRPGWVRYQAPAYAQIKSSLQETILEAANLSGRILGFQSLDRPDFSRANLTATSWMNVKAINAVFRGVRLVDADFGGSDLEQSDFSQATLTYTEFANTNLRSSNFSGATLKSVNFREADMNRALFTGSSLNQVDMDGANLSYADFASATLTDVSASRETMTYCTNFHTATYIGSSLGLTGLDGPYLNEDRGQPTPVPVDRPLPAACTEGLSPSPQGPSSSRG